MEAQPNYMCQICYKTAKQAVSCINSKCSKIYCLFCAQEVVRNATKTQKPNKCPYCRQTPFTFKESSLRIKINNSKLVCKHCKKQFKFVQIQKHENKLCQERLIKCRICNINIKYKFITSHTNESHSNMSQKIIKYFQQSRAPIPDPDQVLKQFVIPDKNYGKLPKIGRTGKFYCQQKLGLLCNCCNGFCGPTNGQNCLKCMKLDLIRRGLENGYLVNARGSVCWKNNQGKFICKNLYESQNDGLKVCGQANNYCKFCKNITINQQRYIDILQK